MDSTPKTKKPMTKDEVMLLLNLIEQLPVLTTKETNAATNKNKEEAWAKLKIKFNSKCVNVPRTKEQLKLKWDNLKKSARKRNQNIRLNLNKTGGGKPDFIPPDEILEKVGSMMGTTLTGFAVLFGGDGIDEEMFTDEHEITEEAQLQSPEINLLPDQSNVKKRKINFSTPEQVVAEPSATSNKIGKHLYGMPRMSVSLQNKGKKKNSDGRVEKNLAVANYYNKMAEKVDLEIKILKKEHNLV